MKKPDNAPILDASIESYRKQIGKQMHTTKRNNLIKLDENFTLDNFGNLGVGVLSFKKYDDVVYHILGFGAPNLSCNDIAINVVYNNPNCELWDLTPNGHIFIGECDKISQDILIKYIIRNTIGSYFEDFVNMNSEELYIRISALPLAMFINVKNLDQKILKALYEQMQKTLETKVCSEKELAELTEKFKTRFDYAAYALSQKLDDVAELKRRNKESLKQIKKSFKGARR